MEIAEIWRYPVKSMAGERLAAVSITEQGLPGDRGIAVFDRSGRRPAHPLSARQVPALLLFRATTGGEEVTVEGPGLPATRWSEPVVSQRLAEACGRKVEIAPVRGGAFDDAPVHVVVLPSLAEVARELGRTVDHRRFRANIYVAAAERCSASERSWPGRRIQVGEAALDVLAECPRCAITTRDLETHQAWPQLLRHLAATRDAMMGVYCAVAMPGSAHEGAAVTIG